MPEGPPIPTVLWSGLDKADEVGGEDRHRVGAALRHSARRGSTLRRGRQFPLQALEDKGRAAVPDAWDLVEPLP